ncbi:MAG TPA: TM2 domain-containing protein, partial [Ktedonobacterales bacterium]|nr:TM2 domain-containing protein [Ktedonobacterales bacterium]
MSIDLASLTARLTPEEQRAVRARYRTQAKNPTTAFLLCFFLGIFGVHRFYLGDVGGGLIRLILSPLIVPGIILEIIDLLRIDAEVAHHNLGVAEGLIARVMLDHPAPHFQTQAGQLGDASLAPSAAASPPPAAAPAAPVAAAAVPLAAAVAAVAAAHPEPWQ